MTNNLLRFAKTFDQDMTKKIEVQRVDFHAAILKAILDGFAVPVTAFVQLEKILTTIGNNIEFSRTKTQDRQQYWLMLTRYDYQELIQTAQPGKQYPSPMHIVLTTCSHSSHQLLH